MQTVYALSKDDLPAHCPPDGVPLWNAHPKIYLTLNNKHPNAQCPYCGSQFILKEKESSDPVPTTIIKRYPKPNLS